MASAYSKSAISASMSAMRALDGQKRKPCRRRRPPTQFKEYNLNAQVQPNQIGYLQPLLEVREEIQSILLQMGFEEMPTNNFVESSFWNFDALFQPQQHPAHDSHAPASRRYLPEDYVERVKLVLESGGYGSKGYGYDWKGKKLIRISFGHTTAVSTRILYMLAQQNQSLGNGTT